MNVGLFLKETAICAAPLVIGYGISVTGKGLATKVSAFVQKLMEAKDFDGQISPQNLNKIKHRSKLHGERFSQITFAIGSVITAILTIAKLSNIISTTISARKEFNFKQLQNAFDIKKEAFVIQLEKIRQIPTDELTPNDLMSLQTKMQELTELSLKMTGSIEKANQAIKDLTKIKV